MLKTELTTGTGKNEKIYEANSRPEGIMLDSAYISTISSQERVFLISIVQSKYLSWSLKYSIGNRKSLSRNGRKLHKIIEDEIMILGLYKIIIANEYIKRAINDGAFK